MKNPWVIIGVLTVALFGGAVWYSSTVAEEANEGVTVAEVQVKGNPDADVVLVEYSDFQCPACGQFYPVVKELIEDYGDQLRFEYKHFPLIRIHPFAEPAARAAEAAGQQGQFFAYHDKLFENQGEWAQSANPARYFAQYAEELGLDMEAFARHQRSSLLRDKVASDMQEALAIGANSTPTFLLNGERLQLTTIGDLRAAVEAALGVSADAATGTSTEATPAATGSASVRFGI